MIGSVRRTIELTEERLKNDKFINKLLELEYLTFKKAKSRYSLRINSNSYLDKTIEESSRTFRDWIDYNRKGINDSYELPLVWIDHDESFDNCSIKFTGKDLNNLAKSSILSEGGYSDHNSQYSFVINRSQTKTINQDTLNESIKFWILNFKIFFKSNRN